MFIETLKTLQCPRCEGELSAGAEAGSRDVASGNVVCRACSAHYPILAGALLLVADVREYLITHVKGLSRYVADEQIPKEHRSAFVKARRQLQAEHIEEDLEAERVTALYLMTHYLGAAEVTSPSPVIAELIKTHWDHGPFEQIKAGLEKRGGKPSVIELGCGAGGLLAALQGQTSSYLGLDSSFTSIVAARHFALGAPMKGKTLVPEDLLFGSVSREIRIAPPKSPPPHSDFIVCELDQPPVKSELWEVAIALNVIDMLPEPTALPQLQHRLLKEGGLAVQSCPYIWHQDVAAHLRETIPRSIHDSAKAVEWLYNQADFKIDSVLPHVPWLFFKHNRQLEIYSVHLFFASK